MHHQPAKHVFGAATETTTEATGTDGVADLEVHKDSVEYTWEPVTAKGPKPRFTGIGSFAWILPSAASAQKSSPSVSSQRGPPLVVMPMLPKCKKGPSTPYVGGRVVSARPLLASSVTSPAFPSRHDAQASPGPAARLTGPDTMQRANMACARRLPEEVAYSSTTAPAGVAGFFPLV